MATGTFVGANGRQRKRPATPLAELFKARYRVEAKTGCWLWTGTRDKDEYGKLKAVFPGEKTKRPILAHRLSWVLHRGPIPAGKLVCHHCDVEPCVNPDHLFIGSQGDNSRDRDQKQRQARGERHGVSKLTDAQVREIRALRTAYVAVHGTTKRRGKTGTTTAGTLKAIATRFGVTARVVRLIMSGEAWRHVA